MPVDTACNHLVAEGINPEGTLPPCLLLLHVCQVGVSMCRSVSFWGALLTAQHVHLCTLEGDVFAGSHALISRVTGTRNGHFPIMTPPP